MGPGMMARPGPYDRHDGRYGGMGMGMGGGYGGRGRESLSGGVTVGALTLVTAGILGVPPAGLVPTSSASVVSVTSGAVDILLFGQVGETSMVLLPLTFEGTSGTEGIA